MPHPLLVDCRVYHGIGQSYLCFAQGGVGCRRAQCGIGEVECFFYIFFESFGCITHKVCI